MSNLKDENASVNVRGQKNVKRTFWTASVFYFLIAFEFFYMASPFAVYFYGLYRPALNFFNSSPRLSWLIKYFMPHAVRQTQSNLINFLEVFGAILAAIGLIGFIIGACQVYYSKLAKRGAVTGGVYNFIRHPQYACFMLWGLGLMLMWPRYIVLIMYVTMIFIYYFLAKAEESECEFKFGQSYIDYKNKTNMFFPFKITLFKKLPSLPQSKGRKALAIIIIYVFSLSGALLAARGLNILSINSLYGVYTESSATISIERLEEEKLNIILDIALSDSEVKSRFEDNVGERNVKLLNYILPTEWYVTEIPMNGVSFGNGHASPSNYNKNLYKVLFNEAEIRVNREVTGKDILTNVSRRIPIVEVWVNLSENRVVGIYEMPQDTLYKNVPVAIY